ncbi:DNA primase [Halorubrum tailed virus 25]|uniref:DNA primase n=1 Tax=Halorubrum tailed virus 25 TaxID=2878006 RepID=A0AAE9BY21_9CAUD|nr:DNA primase [Halorubrum tailed virus 25]UBF22643.1 DNA primase [Halorubrum tailed virus 25]
MSDNAYPTESVEDALRAWAPTYPRRATKYQRWATSIPEAVELVLDAEESPDNWPFISTYSFPNGHTKDGNIPRIDRLFFDFDIPDTDEYRSGGNHADAWARDMSRLLVRTRKVARFLLKSENPDCWQVVLSGHKGVHIDLVFPTVEPSNGDFDQFKNGMASYADSIVEYLKDATGLDDLDKWVDVDSADLGRMRRVPNTKHLGASKAFGEDRFCVPVSLKELAEIGPADYIELTRSRRPVTKAMYATPNEKAGEVLTQRIRTAPTTARSTSSGSTVNRSRIQAYEDRANDSITVDDIPFVLSDRPCVVEFPERDDAFSHRAASHMMEMKAVTEMMEKGVPIQTMIDFLNQHPRADEEYTRERIEQYISRDYNAVTCEKVWRQADQFCLHGGCKIWVDAQEVDTNR